MSTYCLEKPIWSDADFEIMGWHDTTIWSMLADTDNYEFLLDIDYIFKWVDPNPGEIYFKFWVAQATMIFENAHDIKIDIESSQGSIEIDSLLMENPTISPNGKFINKTYTFECQEGSVSLVATGFKMFVRAQPVLNQRQSFNLLQRGGVGFGRKLNAT